MPDEEIAQSGGNVPDQNRRASSPYPVLSARTRHFGADARASHKTSPIAYRSDLDGLRAVAVVSVIACHLGIPYFQGGYVGVDVFFVLSGFLITSLIAHDLDRNTFSLAEFYDRRIRRIAPALFVVLIASSVLASIILLPHALKEFSRSLLAAAFSVSNILFAGQVGYFAPKSETIPLLHTWSLGVEEQYYVLFPLLMIVGYRYGKARLSMWIWGVLAVSLALSIYATWEWPRSAFYQLPMRAWELLFGSVIALRLVSEPSAGWQRQLASALGLTAILTAAVIYTPATTFPGMAALLPCLGAALVIWAGVGGTSAAHRRTWIATILGTRIPVFIGLISYSLYLWHWPLIVFADELMLGPLTVPAQAGVAVATICLATLTWLYVEQPARSGRWPLQTPRRRIAAVAASLSAVTALALTMYVTDGMPSRFGPAVQQIARANDDKSPYRETCHFDPLIRNTFSRTCILGTNVRPTITVFGDSHGVEISAALAEMANARGLSVRQITASDCPPVVGVQKPEYPECDEYVAAMLPEIVAARPMTVVLSAFYFSWFTDPDETRKSWVGFETTVRALRSAGHSVVIMGAVPPQPHGQRIPTVLAKWITRGGRPEDYGFPLDTAKASAVDAKLGAIARKHGATYVPVIPYLCPDNNTCRPYRDGVVLYQDSNHLSMAGARKVAREILGSHVFNAAPSAGN